MMYNDDVDDRKDGRREHIKSKKTHVQSKDIEKKAQKKLNRQFRQSKVDLDQEELWENWQEEYR